MKLNKAYDLVLIRHAQSLFNEATGIVADNLKLNHYSWTQLIQHNEFNKQVSYSSNYFDPLLSEKGKKQCENIKSQCDKIEPDLILVSPYRRALQTCKNLFPHTKAPVIVEPSLAEVFRFSCDIPQQLKNTQQNYPIYDFTNVQCLGSQWYLENLVPQYKSMIKKKVEQHKDHSEIQKTLLQLLSTRQIHENPKMMRARAKTIKDMIKTYKERYDKIVVIAHYYVIQFLKAKGFDENDDIIEYQDIRNCHPYYQKFEQLYKIK